MKPKLSASEVYLRAAELVDADDYGFSCHAVYVVIWKKLPNKFMKGFIAPCKKLDEYEELFRPNDAKSLSGWGHGWGRENEQFSFDYEAQKQCRVLALLLMSAIAADKERK